jgi:hypothetical protein
MGGAACLLGANTAVPLKEADVHGDLRDLQSGRTQGCHCSHCAAAKAFVEFRDLAVPPPRPASITTRREAGALLKWIAFQLCAQLDRIEEAEDVAVAAIFSEKTTPVVASNIAQAASVLQAEKERRQSAKDEAEDLAWAQACSNDDVVMMARKLFRAWGRPAAGVQEIQSPEDVEVLLEQMTEYARTLHGLAESIDRSEGYKEAEAAGTLHRRQPLVLGPGPPRAAYGASSKPVLDVMAKGGDAGGKGRRLTRTEQPRLDEQAQAAARLAALPQQPALVGQSETTVVMHGTVSRFDSRTYTGLVRIGGVEYPVTASAFFKSGATTLTSGQTLEC